MYTRQKQAVVSAPASIMLSTILALISCWHTAYAQGTGTRQRVTDVQHITYHADTFYSSTVYKIYYSGNRGSYFTPEYYTPRLGFGGMGYGPQLDLKNILVPQLAKGYVRDFEFSVLFDSVSVYMHSAYYHPYLAESYMATYDADNRVTMYAQQNGRNVPWYTFIMPGGLRQGMPLYYYLLKDAVGSKLDTIYTHRLYYNSNGSLRADSFGNTQNDRATTFQYDQQSGHLTDVYTQSLNSTSWAVTDRRNYTSDGEGRITRRTQLMPNPATSLPDTFNAVTATYDATGRPVNLRVHDGGASRHIRSFHYNADGLLDTLVEDWFEMDTIAARYKSVFYYNSFRNPDSVLSDVKGNGPNYQYTFRTLYTYEQYNDTDTAAAPPAPPAPASSDNLIIFGNPAHGSFKIRWNKQQPNTPVHISLYNAGGQLVKRTFLNKTSAEDTVPVGGLPPGVYYLRINTSAGGMLYAGGLVIDQ